MVLSRLTKITGPGVSTDTNWVGNNADFTGITTSGASFNIGVTTIHSTLIESHNIVSTGVITATSFSGDGSALTGVANTDFVVGTAITMGTANFTGNVTIGGTLTYEDVTKIDSVGIVTATGLDINGHTNLDNVSIVGNSTITSSGSGTGKLRIEGAVTGTKIHLHRASTDSVAIRFQNNFGNIYAGLRNGFNNDQRFAISNSGTLGNDTIFQASENYNVIVGTAVTFSGTTGNATFTGIVTATELDINGHTNLDNVSVAGVSTFASSIHVADSIIHQGDTDTKIDFATNDIRTTVANKLRIHHASNGLNYFNGNNISQATSTHTKLAGSDYVHRFRDEEGDDTLVQFFNTNVKNTVLEWNDYGSTTAAGNLIFKGIAGGSGLEHARFTGSGNFNLLRDLDVDGHTNLDNVSISGVVTATSYYGDGSNLSNVISGVDVKFEGASVGTGVTMLNFVGFNTVTPPVSGLSTITSGQNLTIGVRSGSAVEASLTGTSFNVIARSGGNISINI